ncbi:MAG: thioredoxin domain-containing protein [Desulfuromusa sp.]
MNFAYPQALFRCFLLLMIVGFLVPINVSAEQTNRLIHEQSPYLLQHAHNPVDWFPWGDEAFTKAHAEGKLIFLSIGYSTCHWCHVMEAESFTDKEVAALLKQNYVAIKVDREERPDIDQFYMQVGIELSGSGGWPLTIIMTPDKIPIFAGTYFGKERSYNRPGLMEILPQVAAAWQKDPQRLLQGGKVVLSTLQQRQNSSTQTKDLTVAQLKQAETALRQSFDAAQGGFSEAPKFPRPHILSFLLQRYYRTADPVLLQMVEKTLQAMRAGGIYDQIGFGFHRYSTDAEWLVPHFEKMLYDQAGLARVYLEAFQLTGKVEYKATAKEIFSYILRRLRDPDGGFYTAEDADSNGVEGQFYVWQEQELTDLLGKKRGERFAQIYNVLPTGNFSAYIPGEPAGTNILHRKKSISDWARALQLPLPELQQQLEEDRIRLFSAREQRIHPFRDDKVISAWNGQMISALALGARALSDPQLLAAAEQATSFIFLQMQTEEGRLLRRWRGGQAAINAFASDYAFLARGMLDLYRSSLNPVYLQKALQLAEQLALHFTDQQGRLFETTAESELPMRTNELYDGALPSAGSVTVEVYARLYLLTGNKLWSQRADALMKSSAAQINRYPAGYTQFLLGASLLLEPTRELVIVGLSHSPDTAALLAEVQPEFMPETTLLLRPTESPGAIDKLVPFIEGMTSVNHQATAYLCQDFACQRPQTKPEVLRKLLQAKSEK